MIAVSRFWFLTSKTGPARNAGSASIVLLAVGLVAVLVGSAVAVSGAVMVARHRAQTAADLGALAAALHVSSGVVLACERAKTVVVSNRAELISCRLEQCDAIVTAAVSPPPGLPRRAAIAGTARAGPGALMSATSVPIPQAVAIHPIAQR